MKKMRSGLALWIALTVNITYATTIDFEGYPSPNPNQGDYYSTLTEDGFLLTKGNGWLVTGINNAAIPDSGSVALLVEGGNNASFTLTSASGKAFDLFGFRASEGRNIQSGGYADYASSGIQVTGHFLAGGSITTSFDLDLIANNDPTTDFQLLTLTGYSALSSVEFVGYGNPVGPRPYSFGHSFGIDDIVVSAIPEPTTILLVVIGLVGLIGARRSVIHIKVRFGSSSSI